VRKKLKEERIMRFFLAILVIIFGTYKVSAAQTIPAEGDAKSIIEQQIQAFLNDDAEGAYTFAAPGVRAIFRTSDIFMAMVKRSYRPIYRAHAYHFGESIKEGDTLGQLVVIEAEDGSAYEALYELVKGSDGVWKIAAVALRKIPGLDI